MKQLTAILLILLFSPLNNLLAQNVGIGTNTPAEKLHIEGNLRVDGDTIMGDPDKPHQNLYTITNGGIQFMMDNDNNGSERFGILHNGLGFNYIFDIDENGNIRADGDLLLNTGGGNVIEMAGSTPVLRSTISSDDLFNITGTGGIRFQLDTDNDNPSSRFSIINGAGGELLSIDEDTRLTLYPVGIGAGNTGGVRFRELAVNGSNYAELRAPDVLSNNLTWTLPSSQGQTGQVLTAVSTGQLIWVYPDVRDLIAGLGTSHGGNNAQGEHWIDVNVDNTTIQVNGSNQLELVPGALNGQYIQNQNSAAQSSANYWISGDGRLSDLYLDGNDITSTGGMDLHSNGIFEIFSSTDARIDLDDDNNGSNSFQIRNGADAVVFEASEGGNVNINGYLDFLETGASPTYQTRLQSADLTSNLTFTLPPTDGNANELLITDGSGVLSWQNTSALGDHDWYGVGTAVSPISINEDIYTQGNVGIGTITPGAGLQIIVPNDEDGNQSTNGLLVESLDNAGDNGDAIATVATNGANGGDPFVSYLVNGVGGWSMGIDNSDDDKFKISSIHYDPGSNTEMTITKNGEVGIGTASPVGTFDIFSKVHDRRLLRVDEAGFVFMEESKNKTGGIEWNYGGSNTNRYGIAQATNGNMAMYTAGSFAQSKISFNLANSTGGFDELARFSHTGALQMEATKGTYEGVEWAYNNTTARYGMAHNPDGDLAFYTASHYVGPAISFNKANAGGTFDKMAEFTTDGDLEFQGNNRGIAYRGKEYVEEWRLIYEDNFQSGTDGWTSSYANLTGNAGTAAVAAPLNAYAGGSQFLRSTNDNKSALKKYFDLTGITFSEIRIQLDYIMIDSWDNNSQDFGYIGVASTETGNWIILENLFPHLLPSGLFWYPGASGFPSGQNNFYGNGDRERVVDINEQVSWPSSEPGIWLMVGAFLDTPNFDEDFGIDNVRIYVR